MSVVDSFKLHFATKTLIFNPCVISRWPIVGVAISINQVLQVPGVEAGNPRNVVD